MFEKAEFSFVSAGEKVKEVMKKFKYPKSGKIEEVNNILEDVLFALNVVGDAPKFVLTRALYPTVDGGDVLERAHFVIRPSVSDALEGIDLRKRFYVEGGKDFFKDFVDQVVAWFDTYKYHSMLQVNLAEFNEVFSSLVKESGVDFEIVFSVGDGLIDASDDYAVVGLSSEVIENLSRLPLFDTELEIRSEVYKQHILDILAECNRPIDIIKVKSDVTKDLGIYTKKGYVRVIRQFVNRKIEFVRLGTGYIDKDGVFAVIDKEAFSAEEIKDFDLSEAVVLDNENPSVKEKEEGKNKIVVTFRISPFNREDGTPVDKKLKDLI